MEKDQNINSESQNEEIKETEAEDQIQVEQEISAEKKEEVKEATPEEKIKDLEEEQIQEGQEDSVEKNQEVKEVTPEEKIKELEDKVARAFAEMENQRRRFEKEKEDAFDYGGFSFAKEALNLIDNLERSKQILESDEVLKDTEALKKTLEHFEIISKDMVSIFSKNGITSCSFYW